MGQMKKADPKLSLDHLCKLFGVSPSTWYYQQSAALKSDPEEEKIVRLMQDIHQQSYGSYGRRRMKKALNNQGVEIGHYKVSRLMADHGIVATCPKKPHYYQGNKAHPTTLNVLERNFTVGQLNTRWVGDITYIRHHQGWSYLAAVMDLGNREVVGYALSQTPDAQLAKDALADAIRKQQPDTRKLLFHSDQGVQYSAELFSGFLAVNQIESSMSRRGNCWDNAVQERFFRSLKTERLNGLSFVNHQSVVEVVEQYIRFYNYTRLNSVIDYMTPVQKRREFSKAA